MLSRMDLLAQMATFVRVVDTKSLTAAARAERLSLPAVSRQLRALEAELGASLIARSTRKLNVTDAGRQWYAYCVRILREVDEARNALRGTAAPEGTLVVSASLTFGSVILLPLLGKLARKHPRLVIDLRLEDRLADLIGDGVDLALRAGSAPPDSTALIAQPLSSMHRILVAAPRWLKRNGSPREPEHLARHPCLVQVTPAGNVVRWTLCRNGTVRSIEVPSQLRTNAPLAIRDLAVNGMGVAFLPDWLVAGDLASGRLRRVLPDWSSVPITAWAIYRSELRGAARVRAFLDVLPREKRAFPVS